MLIYEEVVVGRNYQIASTLDDCKFHTKYDERKVHSHNRQTDSLCGNWNLSRPIGMGTWSDIYYVRYIFKSMDFIRVTEIKYLTTLQEYREVSVRRRRYKVYLKVLSLFFYVLNLNQLNVFFPKGTVNNMEKKKREF